MRRMARPAKDPRRRFGSHEIKNPAAAHHALAADHPALAEGRTLFPKSLLEPTPGVWVLKTGNYQRKLGDRVSKGAWRGFPIFSLTLQERATCPPACHAWSTCYGNAMPFSRRWHAGENLEAALQHDLAHLDEFYPEGFVVRLHILGDFCSVLYVARWRDWLERFPALRVFGYTARRPAEPIGRAIEEMNRDFPDRCVIRLSHPLPGPMRAVTITRVPEGPVVHEGVVCPAQTGKTECCGSCSLCWSESFKQKTIVFIRHGMGPRGRAKGKRNAIQSGGDR